MRAGAACNSAPIDEPQWYVCPAAVGTLCVNTREREDYSILLAHPETQEELIAEKCLRN